MSKNPFELHEERLGTTAQDGSRIYLYMDKVKGKWEKYRHISYYFLVIWAMIIPWTKMGGKQTLLFDIPNREYFIFGEHFYAHDIPLFFIIMLSFIIMIALVTALWGRIWCGWACPQTVLIEVFYRQIETLVEGRANVRRRRDNRPMNFDKFIRKTIKWLLFLLVSIAMSHSVLAYFVGSEKLFYIVFQNPKANWTLFTISMFLSGLFLFDFGWFREQFCLIACPYGRFQAVFMDKDSLVVGYDKTRGEPRRQHKRNAGKDVPEGDCISCYKCVQVCPTGIDIRRGSQLECIHCTRCIDACDEVMDKVKKPRGLIRYTTEAELEGGKTKYFRPRTIIYLVVITAILSVGTYVIQRSKNLQVLFLRGRTTFYETQINQKPYIVNNYKVQFFYRNTKEIDLNLKVIGKYKDLVNIVVPMKDLKLRAGRKTSLYVFFQANKKIFEDGGSQQVEVAIYDGETLITTKKVSLVGPSQ